MNPHKDKAFHAPSKFNTNNLVPGHIVANIKKKKKIPERVSEKNHVSYKGTISLQDANHRCQMPENNAISCVSSTCWGEITALPVFYVQLYYHLSYGSQTLVDIHTARRRD